MGGRGAGGGGAAVAGGGDEPVDRLAQGAGGQEIGGVGAHRLPRTGVACLAGFGFAVGAELADPGVEGGAGEFLDRVGAAAVAQGADEVQADPAGALAEGGGLTGRRGGGHGVEHSREPV
ncbi:hypothetical protein GCM10009727_78360 [Actinomadura napierensis]|uniref:Uncharacterized protein n=1 Tax=Actinomadura napierensis TaxID=267854 RepID=A0ABP5M3W6_9ACTN